MVDGALAMVAFMNRLVAFAPKSLRNDAVEADFLFLAVQNHNLRPCKQPRSAQTDSSNVIVRGEGGRSTTVWTIRGMLGQR